jgi:hypothetical protein
MKSRTALIAGALVIAFSIAASSGHAADRKPATVISASASASNAAPHRASANTSASASASLLAGPHRAALGFEVGARIPWGDEMTGGAVQTSLASVIDVAIPLRADIHFYTWPDWYIGVAGEWAWLHVSAPQCNGQCIGSNWIFAPLVVGYQPSIHGVFAEFSAIFEITGLGQNRPDSPSSLHLFGALGELRVGYDFLLSDQWRLGIVAAGSAGAYVMCVSTVNTTQVTCGAGNIAPHGWITLGLRSLFRL